MVFICFYRFSTEELRLAAGASAPVARKKKTKTLEATRNPQKPTFYFLYKCENHILYSLIFFFFVGGVSLVKGDRQTERQTDGRIDTETDSQTDER